MGQPMSMAQIKSSYHSEWVLVADPEFDEQWELVRGNVLFHSQDRHEVYRKDEELRPRSAAYVYTGPAPENVLINL